jgi:hypothetical protein
MGSRAFSTSLRSSILASLGLLPLACGGTAQHGENGSAGSGANAAAGSEEREGGSQSGGATGGGTTTAGGATGGGTTTAGGGTGFVPVCTAPEMDAATGIVTCAEGTVHRTRSSRCARANPNAAPLEPDPRPPAKGLSVPVDCTNDSSACNEFRHPYCAETPDVPWLNVPYGKVCTSRCLTDSDCGDGGLCRCEGGEYGICTQDSCDSDADCRQFLCTSYPSSSGGEGREPFVCDQARGGRPFLVEAEERVAPIAARADWAEGGRAAPRLAHLGGDERAALAAHWTKLGQMEHASIAAFARFQLQLLSLGAPPELVQACNQALVDETAHAQLCFGLASAYAGRAIGPGPLDVSHSLAVTDLADIVGLVIHEGCFGETSAALEALEAATSATDPVVRDVYRTIADDEGRHAELAFRFVQWALGLDRAAVSERVRAILNAPPVVGPASLAVALPCLRALLDAPAVARSEAPTTPARS